VGVDLATILVPAARSWDNIAAVVPSRSRMKVLHVSESIKGGCGSYLNQLIPLQAPEFGRDNVLLVAPRQHAGQIPNIEPELVQYFDRPHRSSRSLLDLARCVRALVRSYRPDIIHAHSTFAGLVVRMLYGWSRSHRSIVYCPHGWVFHTTRQPAYRYILQTTESLLAPLCDEIIAISEYEAREGARIGIAPSRMRVIYNGLSATPPVAADCAWNDPRLRVLFVGRLDRQKGFDIACEALRTLEDKVHMRVAGDAVHGVGRAPSAIPRNIELLGWRNEAEITSLLEKADLVLMPSRWEGFGLVAAEAMRAGKPVLASSVGGLPEVIEDGVTGILVPPESPGAIREVLLAFDRAKAREMGAAGRERFQRLFTSDRMSKEIVALYRSRMHDKLMRPRMQTT
jgi:glycosyltransferase involved in cell wall biosynthesis